MLKRSVLFCAFVIFLLSSAGTVLAQPLFSKSFVPPIIGPGSVSTLTFLISNDDPSNPVTDLAFTDNLPAGLVIATPANPMTTCTDGLLIAPEGDTTITFSGGRLGAAEICVVVVNVTSSAAGTHTNVSGDLTSSAGNSGPATADLIVDPARPGFLKSFSPASISVGQTSTLTLTIDNTANAAAADGLAFVDILPAGMVIDNPSNALTTCTGGAQPPVLTAAPGTSLISLTDGYVPASSTCKVSLTVMAAGAGVLGNVTGILVSSAGDSGMASAVLDVQRHFLVKSFSNDPVLPGHTVTLEFTLTNFDRFNSATGISFTDDLSAVVPGLTAVGLPLNDACGPGSQISGTSVLTFTGGNLAPEATCTFSVTLQVPSGTAAGAYTNTTSQVSMDIGGIAATESPATDTLTVIPPLIAKSFTDDPVAPGGSVTLQFTLTNSSPVSTVTNIAFTDDLSAALSGLTATDLPLSDICGPGSQISGTSLLTFTGGSLAPGASCTFSVTLQVPPAASSGAYVNLTSAVTADIDGTPTTLDPATDTLLIQPAPAFSKSFGPNSILFGGLSTLTFTIDNTASALAATGLSFTDNLPAGMTVAAPANASTTCTGGTLTAVTGSNTITYSDGTVSAGATCTVRVDVTGGVAGVSVNTTGPLTSAAGSSGTATAQLTVGDQPPTLAKSFGPGTITGGGNSTLTFTVDNTAATVAAAGIGFTDNLPTGMVIAAPANASTTCIGGTLTAVSGAGVITYSGGTVAAGSSCTVSVDVRATAPGTYNNTTGNLASTLGSSGTASAALIVSAAVPVAIPTLTEWGMIIFMIMAGLGAVFILLRLRKETQG